MGCGQASRPTIVPNHFPIQPIYIEEPYPIIQEPAVMTNAPLYTKSSLKKISQYEQPNSFLYQSVARQNRFMSKSVNFDEQVLVKARTPTPNKIWYEKESSTMPIRENPSIDDDNEDSNEEEQDIDDASNQDMNSDSYIPRLGTPTSLMHDNQDNPYWPQTNTTGRIPSFNTNISSTDDSNKSNGNRIKVRRRLAATNPTQTLTGPSFRPPQPIFAHPPFTVRPMTTLNRPYMLRPSVLPTYRIRLQAPTAHQNQPPFQNRPPYQPHQLLMQSTSAQPLSAPQYTTPIRPSSAQPLSLPFYPQTVVPSSTANFSNPQTTSVVTTASTKN